MYKLSCTYKDRPADPFSVKMVDGRCRVFLACALGTAAEDSIEGTEIKLYSGSSADATKLRATVSSTIDSSGEVACIAITNFPPGGILFEDGVFAVMGRYASGVSVFHNGGVSSS